MTDLFPRANQIGLGCIQSWLPNGRLVGNEWTATIEFTEDTVIVNTKNGEWINANTNAVGPHCVSLYDYLNKINDQAVSAKTILEKYDPNYFPSDKDEFIVPELESKTVVYVPVKQEEEKSFLDDDSHYPFRILGISHEKIWVHCLTSKRVITIPEASINKNHLIRIAPMKWWGTYFVNPNGGIAWTTAADDILRRAEMEKQFDQNRIRKSGAWRDKTDVIYHAGEHLLINGKKVDLLNKNNHYIYEKSRVLPIDIDKKLTLEESMKFSSLCRHLIVKSAVQNEILAGWCLLAPFGGALKWRPHIWITGPAGSGKSWVLDNVIAKMVGNEFGIKGTGTSTPAGIRQNLQSMTLGVVLDEMESDNKKHADYIEQILKMFREASSGIESAASTLHGSVDQSGRSWLVRSMACFASIGASLRQDADIDRFSLITMKTMDKRIEERIEMFKQLENESAILTLEYGRAFVARTYSLFDEVLRCIDVMIEQATDIIGSRRHGDQVGTLLAGAWMVDHDQSATAREAREWLTGLEIDQINSVSEERSTEQKAIEEILAYQIRITDGHASSMQTIGTCIDYLLREVNALEPEYSFPGGSQDGVRRTLEQYGLKAFRDEQERMINIAVGHPALQRVLSATPYANVYGEYITRLDCCDGRLRGPGLFAGIRKRYLQLRADLLFDEVPF